MIKCKGHTCLSKRLNEKIGSACSDSNLTPIWHLKVWTYLRMEKKTNIMKHIKTNQIEFFLIPVHISKCFQLRVVFRFNYFILNKFILKKAE